MLCEDCQKNQATVVVTVTAGGEISQRHLCPQCMVKIKNSFTLGDVQSFLSSLLSVLAAKPQTPTKTCPDCGLSREEFERTGKLGCAQCYRTFAEELQPLLFRIHGRSQHAGRVPDAMKSQVAQEQQISELRQKMEAAIATENFEEAAILRDEIALIHQQAKTEERS